MFWEPLLHLNAEAKKGGGTLKHRRERELLPVLLLPPVFMPRSLSRFVYIRRGKPIARGLNSESFPTHLGMHSCWFYSQMYPNREEWELSAWRECNTERTKGEKECSCRYEGDETKALKIVRRKHKGGRRKYERGMDEWKTDWSTGLVLTGSHLPGGLCLLQ